MTISQAAPLNKSAVNVQRKTYFARGGTDIGSAGIFRYTEISNGGRDMPTAKTGRKASGTTTKKTAKKTAKAAATKTAKKVTLDDVWAIIAEIGIAHKELEQAIKSTHKELEQAIKET
ncbi:MAG: hypothetical protein LBG79_00310, partial [Spirochaetaceae bacterium]|nr:hypothetical protein [Spirochaetaceae bacterium]